MCHPVVTQVADPRYQSELVTGLLTCWWYLTLSDFLLSW